MTTTKERSQGGEKVLSPFEAQMKALKGWATSIDYEATASEAAEFDMICMALETTLTEREKKLASVVKEMENQVKNLKGLRERQRRDISSSNQQTSRYGGSNTTSPS